MELGKIFFAYADDAEVYDDLIHSVEDESVFSLEITQSEGEFARAKVEIINPGVGLLSPGRKQRVFISCEYGITKKLLFSGRMIGFPVELGDEVVSLEFIAQPQDWTATQETFLNGLKVAPYYNPLFTPEESRSDPAELLIARSELLHWHRATGALTLSDILEGSNTIDLGEDFLFDTLSTEVGDPPLSSVYVEVEVQWNQVGVGVVNCGESIRQAFTNTAIATPQINTLTPLSFEAGWKGARVPAGYSIIESVLTPIADGFGLTNDDLRSGNATVDGADYPTKTGATPASRTVTVPRVWYTGRLYLQANYEQKRREVMFTTVSVATQDISLTADQQEVMSIRLQDPTAVAQTEVLDVGKPSFFYEAGNLTAYGQEAVEHAVLRGMARLKKASRTIEIQFDCNIDDVIDITCDDSVRIQDDRLPNGSARGKVLGYTLRIDGDGGNQEAQIKIGCAVGTGADSAGAGTSIGAREYDNEVPASVMDSAVFYQVAAPPVIDEPIDVAQMEADEDYLVDNVIITDGGESQNTGWMGSSLPDQYLDANRTKVEVELKSMNPEPELYSEIEITCSAMTLPRHIDLEAV